MDNTLQIYENEFIDVQGARTDAFIKRSDKSAPDGTIVFIHGWPDNYKIWEKHVDHFKTTHDCVSIALPQFLPSHKKLTIGHEQLDSKNVAKNIHSLVLKTMRTEKYVLCVHDFGAVYGALIQEMYPESIEKIVAMDVWTWKVSDPQYMMFFRAYQGQNVHAYAHTAGSPDKVKEINDKWFSRIDGLKEHFPYFPQGDEKLDIHCCHGYWGIFKEQCTDKQVMFDGDKYPKCPLLFFNGELGSLKFFSDSLIAKINADPNSKHIPLDCDHWIPQRKAAETIAEMDRFIKYNADLVDAFETSKEPMYLYGQPAVVADVAKPALEILKEQVEGTK